MEKVLKLYKVVDDDRIKVPFPYEDKDPAEIVSFTYNASRMGAAPLITCTLMYGECLDDLWSDRVYVEFKGEKYFIKDTPSSSYSSSDSRYKHEIELSSERVVLDNVYFFDVVSEDYENDKPKSNSSDVVFFGDINEFVSRLNASLNYSHLEYRVVIDNGVSSEEMLVSLKDQSITSALNEIYNLYELQYYFDGKTIHIGKESSIIDHTFEYGADNALISINKTNEKFKIVNRCSGRGSSDNLPPYYPNESPYGTVACLLNGEESDRINVVDWLKFSKCGPNGVLEYKSYWRESELIGEWTLEDRSKVERVFAGYLLDVPLYNLVVEVPFNINVPFAEVQASCSINYTGLGYTSIAILDEDDIVIASRPYNLYFEEPIKLTYGEYKFRCTFPISRLSIEEALELAYISINAYDDPTQYEAWELNGEVVNLGYIGITFVGEPSIGDKMSFRVVREGLTPQPGNLLPHIFRETNGEERFYNAESGVYPIPDREGELYVFENEFFEGDPKEHIADFEDIRPTIEGILNADGQRIDEFIEFEYDLNDNDELDETGENYLHPYFYGKLRKFDGDNGFNLFAHALEGGSMTISMKSGNCGGCSWTIGVNESTMLNTVQVYEQDTTDEDGTFHAAGSLKRLQNGDVYRSGSPQDIQNDTTKNEVWVALKKDIDTFGVIMPNAANNYKPNGGDRFVILDISLPQAYIESAERRLSEEVIKYMADNNSEKFSFSIQFSRIFLAENKDIYDQLDENASITILYNGQEHTLQISSYSYKMDASSPLPEVAVELTDKISVHKGIVRQVAETVQNRIISVVKSVSVESLGLDKKFARTDRPSLFREKVSFEDQAIFDRTIRSSDFSSEPLYGAGWGLYTDNEGASVLEIDKIYARRSLFINELTINQSQAQKGPFYLTLAGCLIKTVEELDGVYRCYYDNEGNSRHSGFVDGDQALCQMYDSSYTNIFRYYWRLVVGATEQYVDLSKTDFDGDAVPLEGDVLVQLGNRSDVSRQNAILMTSTPTPSITQYKGIDSFSITDANIVTKVSQDENKFSGRMTIEPGSEGATNLSDLPQVVSDSLNVELNNAEFGKYNMIRNSGFSGDYSTVSLTDYEYLSGDSDLFSSKLAHWESLNVNILDSEISQSGYEASLEDGALRQEVYPRIIKGENYVLSFKAKGQYMDVSIGGISRRITFKDEYQKYVEKFVAQSDDSSLVIANATCVLCDLQLERGTIGSSWGYSPLDNSSDLAYYQSLQYLANAIKSGNTTMLGGLILSQMIYLGNYLNGNMSEITAGISGIYNEARDVAFWGGGTYEQAISTVLKYISNPHYKPTEEELSNMANFVVTHGGDVFMRGYIHALGGVFSGEVSIADKKIQLNEDGSGHFADGRLSWSDRGLITSKYPETKQWIDWSSLGYSDGDHISIDNGGYFKGVRYSVDELPQWVIMPSECKSGDAFRISSSAVTRNEGGVLFKCNSGELFKYAGLQDVELQWVYIDSLSGLIEVSFRFEDDGYWNIEEIVNAYVGTQNIVVPGAVMPTPVLHIKAIETKTYDTEVYSLTQRVVELETKCQKLEASIEDIYEKLNPDI